MISDKMFEEILKVYKGLDKQWDRTERESEKLKALVEKFRKIERKMAKLKSVEKGEKDFAAITSGHLREAQDQLEVSQENLAQAFQNCADFLGLDPFEDD